MDEQVLTDLVIRRLGRRVSPNSIVREVCETTDMTWYQAEAFVRQVEISHQRRIARCRISRISEIIIVSLAALTVGVLLAVGLVFVLDISPYRVCGALLVLLGAATLVTKNPIIPLSISATGSEWEDYSVELGEDVSALILGIIEVGVGVLLLVLPPHSIPWLPLWFD